MSDATPGQPERDQAPPLGPDRAEFDPRTRWAVVLQATTEEAAKQLAWGIGMEKAPIIPWPVAGAHLDPERAAEVLDWCKREGGLDLYGWGDLISRLQDCIVPLPPDAQARVSDAYRQGYRDALAARPEAQQ